MAILDSTNVIINGRVIEITGQVMINSIGVTNEGTPVYAGGVLKRIAIASDVTSNMYEITIPFAKTYVNRILIMALNNAGLDQVNYKMTIQFPNASFNFQNVFAKQGPSIEGGSNTIESVLVGMQID